jgi:hypothetical protein
VQIRVAVLTLAGLAGAVYVGGVLLFAHSLATRAALVAFAALAAYAAARPEPAEAALGRASGDAAAARPEPAEAALGRASGDAAAARPEPAEAVLGRASSDAALSGRSRGAVPLALGVLAVGVGVIAEKDVTEFGWFAYAPLSQSPPVRLGWSAALAPHHRLAIGLAVAAVLLVLAALVTPRDSAKRAALLSLVLVPAAAYVVVRAVAVAGRQPAGTGPALADLALGGWALLLATVALAVAAALGRGWLFTAGAVLVALVALRFLDVALGLMPVPGTAFLEPGMVSGTGPLSGFGRDWAGALAAAALFAGGLLAVLGLTRRSSAPAVVLPEDPGDGVEA